MRQIFHKIVLVCEEKDILRSVEILIREVAVMHELGECLLSILLTSALLEDESQKPTHLSAWWSVSYDLRTTYQVNIVRILPAALRTRMYGTQVTLCQLLVRQIRWIVWAGDIIISCLECCSSTVQVPLQCTPVHSYYLYIWYLSFLANDVTEIYICCWVRVSSHFHSVEIYACVSVSPVIGGQQQRSNEPNASQPK